jgi:RNA polymerase sigma factor (sigma-70 family)
MVVASGEVRLPRFLRRDAGVEVDRLYRKHSGEVLRYASLVLRSRTDAEDITQTVFIRALRAIERGETVRAPRNWLIKITHNECRRLLASRKLHIELPDEIAVEPVETGRAEELRAAMAALPATQRQALVLRELEGRTYAEIAQSLDLSESAIETLIFRARRALREQIENAMSCEEFTALLDDPSARTRVRAHARLCPACATLDRQSRGRKSALKRIASAFGLPWWGAKLAAVALTTATVAAVTVIPHDGTRPSIPAPSRVNLAPRTTQPTTQLNLIPPTKRSAHAAPQGGTRFKPVSPSSGFSATSARAVSTTTVTTTAVSPPTVVLPGPEPPAPPTPEPEPAPAPPPVPPPTKLVPTPAPVATPAPTVTVPEVTLPAVTIPTVTVPLPTVSVPLPVPAPGPPTVTLPVQTPKVSLP